MSLNMSLWLTCPETFSGGSKDNPLSHARRLKQKEVMVSVVGIGKAKKNTEKITAIASRPSNLFVTSINDVNSVHNVLEGVQYKFNKHGC